MKTLIGEDSVSFWEELPVPDANIAVYKQVYALEQWLRRIAYAALMAKYGSGWRGTLNQALTADLKRRLRQLNGRVYLDCENSDNVIWLLTLDEFQGLLLGTPNWPAVKELTGLPKRVLESKLSEIREIRNVIGHNRAIGGKAELLMTAATSALDVGIENFKTQLLYNEPLEIHIGHPEDYQENSVPARFAEMTTGNDWSVFSQC